MNIAGGGSALLNPVVGPNCYLGMTCGFSAGYVGTFMSYALLDGTTATRSTRHVAPSHGSCGTDQRS
jgi:hypothetical protein